MYTIAYLGRYSYNSNIKIIGEYFSQGKDATGLVSSMFFFFYGAGQIINGLLCKRYNKRIMLSLSLIVSAIINLVIALGVHFTYFKFLWLLNGVSQSILWSSLILVLSENLDDQHLKKAIVVMSTCVPAGTFLAYGASALFSTFTSYNASFLLAAVGMSVVGILWFFTETKVTCPTVKVTEKVGEQPKQKNKLASSLIVTIIIICVFAIICNLVKDGLQTWTPDILGKKFTLPNSLSIMLTLLLPLVGVLGATIAVKVQSIIKNYVVVLGVFFLLAGALLTAVILLMNVHWVPVIACMSIAFCMSQGMNNVITSIAPLQLRDKINSGMITGVFNGCCYVGSTISGYGLGSLVESSGNWNVIFWLMVALCAIAAIVSLIYILLSKRKPKQTNA